MRSIAALIIFSFLAALFLFGLANAGVDLGDPEIFLVSPIGPEQHFEGFINASFQDVDAGSKLAISLLGGSPLVEKEFSLISILDKQLIPYSCQPADCQDAFTANNPSTSKEVKFNCRTFPCEKTTAGLKIETVPPSNMGNVEIENIEFTIRGEAISAAQESQVQRTQAGDFPGGGILSGGVVIIADIPERTPNPILDIGADGTEEWMYLESTNELVVFPNKFDLTDKIGVKPLSFNSEFCQKVTLMPSKNFAMGAYVHEMPPAKVYFELRDFETYEKLPLNEIICGDLGSPIFYMCVYEYTLTEKKDFLACLYADEGEGAINRYGGGSGNAYFYNREDPPQHIPFDFPIYAGYGKLKPFDYTLTITDEELVIIKEAIQDYIDNECDSTAQSCVIPFKFTSPTPGTIHLENLVLVDKRGKFAPENMFYSVDKDPAELNSSALIDLSLLNITTPTPEGYPDDYDSTWTLLAEFLDSEGSILSSLSENFEIQETIIVQVTPLLGIAGFPISFDASSSYSPESTLTELVKFEWDFGDGETQITALPIVSHTYLEVGNYTLTLKITDENGLTGTGTFIMEIGSSYGWVGGNLDQKFADLESFQASLLLLDSFEREIAQQFVDVDALEIALQDLQNHYNGLSALSGTEQTIALAGLHADISALEIPFGISSSAQTSTTLIPSVYSVEPNYINMLSGENVGIKSETADAIISWHQDNLDVTLDGSVKGLEYDFGTQNIYSKVKISLIQFNTLSKYYLVLSLPGTVLGYKEIYNSDELAPGIIGFELTDEDELILVMDSTQLSSVNAFASPALSALSIGGFSFSSNAIWIILIVVLVLLIIAAVVFFIWRQQHAKPATARSAMAAKISRVPPSHPSRVFKTKSDYMNIVSFIKKNLPKKSRDEIRRMLLKSGWTPEQVSYAMRAASK